MLQLFWLCIVRTRDVIDTRAQITVLQISLAQACERAALAEQASKFHEGQATYWKRVASRFINQIGCKDGIISVPAMTEPAPSAPPAAHGIFRGMATDSLPQRSQETAPNTAPAILGVDEAAALDAVAAALSTTR